jgi:DNA-directed RNA polymerase delta subunit
LWGFSFWPEINPKNVRDKAYNVFKKSQKPLHFREVASLVGNALAQTVHNELIKDPRFVLVGRGLYALREWGFEPGTVREVILKILKEKNRPMNQKEILAEVLKRRWVKKNTVLCNLQNKKYFKKTKEGKYILKEA